MGRKKGYKKATETDSRNQLRLRELIGKMKQLLNVEDRIELLLVYMSSSLCFYIGNHLLFLEEFEKEWKSLGFKNFENKSSIICSNSEFFYADKHKEYSEICLRTGLDEVTRWRCTKIEAMLIIGTIIIKRDIMSQITQPNQIPTSIIRGFLATRIEIKSCFPNLEKDNDLLPNHPWWIEYSINGSRYMYHKMRIGSVESRQKDVVEMDIEQSDESSSISATSDVEYHMLSSKGWDIILKGDQVVQIVEGNKPYQSGLKMHPYTLSASVFCIANYLTRIIKEESGVEYSPTDVYLFMKSWMESGSGIRNNTNMPNIHKLIIDWTNILILYISNHKDDADSNVILKKDFGILLNLFSNIRDVILAKHRKKNFKHYNHGKFENYTLVEYSKLGHLKSDISQVIYNSPEIPPTEKLLAMVFKRSDVSEMKLYASMNIIERLFSITKTKNTYWRIEHDQESIYIVLHSALYNSIRRYCIPYIPFQFSTFDRNTWTPVYLLHLHNYMYGDNMGLLNSIKFMLKQFTKLINDHEVMPKTSDPNICFYKILHMIINRYGSTEAIWDELVYPLNSIPFLWTAQKQNENKRQRKKVKQDETVYIKGFREGTMSLYSALRSFAFINERHYIKRVVLEKVRNEFVINGLLQEKYSLTWNLVLYLYENAPMEEDIEIPSDLPSDDLPLPDNEDGTPPQRFPLHMLLYYFCCAPEIEDSLATLLFRSIGINLRGHNGHGASYPGMIFCTKRFGLEEAEKNKYSFMDIERVFYSEYKDINNENDVSSMGGISFLFKALEELSLYPIQVDLDTVCCDDSTTPNKKRKRTEEEGEMYRGFATGVRDFVNIHPFHVLSSENSPIDKIPVDFKNGEPMTPANSFPIWNLEMHEVDSQSSVDIKFAIDLDANDLEPRPFFDSSDILSCIIMNPITKVKVLWADREEELEMRRLGYMLPGFGWDDRVTLLHNIINNYQRHDVLGTEDHRINNIRKIFDLLVELTTGKYTIEELMQLATSFHYIHDHYKKRDLPGNQTHMLIDYPIANKDLRQLKIIFIGINQSNEENYSLEQLVKYSIAKKVS